MPLGVLQRKKDTANQAAVIVPTFAVFSRVNVTLEPAAPLAPLSVPVSDTSSRRPIEPESPAETENISAVRVVSTVVMFVVLLAVVLVIVVEPPWTVLPSLSATTSRDVHV